MYVSSVGGNVLKAQVQNHYEKVRCDLYVKDVARRQIHSLANINKSIKEARDTLRDIQANSGYCKGNESASKSNVRDWRSRKSQPSGGNRKTSAFPEIPSKNLEPSVSKTSVDAVSQRLLFHEKDERNVLEKVEYSMYGESGAGNGNAGDEMNGDRSDIVPAGRLLRDEILALPNSRNASGRVVQRTNRQAMDASAKNSDDKEPRGKSQGKSTFQDTGATSTKRTGKSLGSRTDAPPESVIGASNTRSDGLTGYRSQTAPEKASRLKLQVKSSPASEGELRKNSRSRSLSASDAMKVKIHASLSRTERKKILQELIASCAVPRDRSALERQRQRILQEKIHKFFELLFEQDNKDDKDDESDKSADD